jgi:hypothetical protein
MTKSISTALFATLLALSISGCNNKEPKPAEPAQAQFGCKQENVPAPKWTCIPLSQTSYLGVGIATKSAAGMGFMRKVALANGRSDLAQQIKTQVKDKITNYTNTTGVGESETVDAVNTSISKQVSNVSLEGSSAIDAWTAPSGALYMLVSVDKKGVNKQIVDNIKSSFNNDKALYQEFKSKNALEELSKEFE